MADAPSNVPTDAAIENTENYLVAYGNLADWIRFADAKAGAVLALHGAISAVLIPTVSKLAAGPPAAATQLGTAIFFVALGLFGIWLVLTIVSAVAAFACIAPRGGGPVHPADTACPHFHPSGIVQKFPDVKPETVQRFVRECRDGGMQMFEKEVIAGLLIDSHVSAHKYGAVSHAIRFAVLSLVAGFVYLGVAQFL